MSKLSDSEHAIDAIKAEIADTRKELELIGTKIRDREADRNALALSKGDPRAVAEFNRLGEEIQELREQIAFHERRLELLPTQIQAAQQAKNTAIADGLTKQADALLAQFKKVELRTIASIAGVMAADHKELRELQTAIEKIADKRRELLGKSVQRLSVPQLIWQPVDYVCRLAREIANGTVKV